MPPARSWTPDDVGRRLVEAYSLVQGRPVLSDGGHFVVERPLPGGGLARNRVDDVVAAFGWPERFLSDGRDRRILRTWASCVAAGEHVAPRYRGHGWPEKTADRHRRAALAAIAAGLNAACDAEALTMA